MHTIIVKIETIIMFSHICKEPSHSVLMTQCKLDKLKKKVSIWKIIFKKK